MSPPPPSPPRAAARGKLPRGVRLAAAVCGVLSALSGLFAVQEAAGLSDLSRLREVGSAGGYGFGLDETVARHAMDVQLGVLEGMREGRTATLAALAVACFLSFIASVRLLRPAGIPRENMRRLLGFSALAAAVLRTIDGAQWAAVSRQVGRALAEGLARQPEGQAEALAEVLPHLPSVAVGIAMLWTALVVGAFVGLAQYFRSERVRSALTLLDGRPSSSS